MAPKLSASIDMAKEDKKEKAKDQADKKEKKDKKDKKDKKEKDKKENAFGKVDGNSGNAGGKDASGPEGNGLDDMDAFFAQVEAMEQKVETPKTGAYVEVAGNQEPGGGAYVQDAGAYVTMAADEPAAPSEKAKVQDEKDTWGNWATRDSTEPAKTEIPVEEENAWGNWADGGSAEPSKAEAAAEAHAQEKTEASWSSAGSKQNWWESAEAPAQVKTEAFWSSDGGKQNWEESKPSWSETEHKGSGEKRSWSESNHDSANDSSSGAVAEAGKRYTGKIKKINWTFKNGWGFIQCDEIQREHGSDAFLSTQEFTGKEFSEGESVTFTLEMKWNDKKAAMRPQAINVEKVGTQSLAGDTSWGSDSKRAHAPPPAAAPVVHAQPPPASLPRFADPLSELGRLGFPQAISSVGDWNDIQDQVWAGHTALPQNWIRIWSRSSGVQYYLNVVSMETTWQIVS